jgi:hypothetical protein
VALLIAYPMIGCLFAIAFVAVGIQRVDPLANGSGLGFRVLVLPGVAALWPWFLYRWVRSLRYKGEESHR